MNKHNLILLKIFIVVFTFTIFIPVITNAQATKTPNGVNITSDNDGYGENSVTLYCRYSDGTYTWFQRSASDDVGEYGDNPIFHLYVEQKEQCTLSDDCLDKMGFVSRVVTSVAGVEMESRIVDCPKYVIGTAVDGKLTDIDHFSNSSDATNGLTAFELDTNLSECMGKYNLTTQLSGEELDPPYTCTYTGQETGKQIIISYDGTKEIITYPDGGVVNKGGKSISGSSNCRDFFINESTKEVKNLYANLCIEADNPDWELYCNGTCDNYKDSGCNVANDCSGILTQDLIDAINDIFGVIKIIAVILVIVLGCIDFAKAVVSQDNDALKKATVSFGKRCIALIILFFLPYLVNLILSLPGLGIEDATCGVK